jgi:hypothetical protein
MTRKLNQADRAAVDLMFDRIHASGGRSNGNGGNGGQAGYVSMTGAVAEERVSAVQQILKTLDAMPAPEPSPDLVVRTLQRVAREGGAPAGATMPAAHQPFIDPTQPMA